MKLGDESMPASSICVWTCARSHGMTHAKIGSDLLGDYADVLPNAFVDRLQGFRSDSL